MTSRNYEIDKNEIGLLCPLCANIFFVYHLGWSSLVCIHCKKEVTKNQFLQYLSAFTGYVLSKLNNNQINNILNDLEKKDLIDIIKKMHFKDDN